MLHLHSTVYTVNEGTPPPGQPWSDPETSSGNEKGRRKVLVVDDQRLVADTVREVLEHAGFEARAAYDGWEALDIIPDFQPDFLLSDVLMPHMNGVELAIIIQKAQPRTRILLFSGQAGVSEILEEAQARGYQFELLPKPLHPRVLIERLREH